MYYFLAGMDRRLIPLVVGSVSPLVVGALIAAAGGELLIAVVVGCLAPVVAVLVVELSVRLAVARRGGATPAREVKPGADPLR